MTWTLIFSAGDDAAPHLYVVHGDPQEQGRLLMAEHEYLRDCALIAAVEGEPRILTRNDAHSVEECSLH